MDSELTGFPFDRSGSEPLRPVLCRISSQALSDLVEIESESNAPAWSAALFSDEFNNPNSYFFGAQCSEKLIGYLCANIVLSEGHILKFGVRGNWRRQGVGKSLLLYALGELSLMRVSVVWLEVRQSNKVALKLYESLGFIKVGKRKGYYSDNNEDAVLMKYSYQVV